MFIYLADRSCAGKHLYSSNNKIFSETQKCVMIPETERRVPPPLQCKWDLAQKESLDPIRGCSDLSPYPVPSAALT